MIVFVDSDILIEVFRARNQNVISNWVELSATGANILYSPVNAAELWAGARQTEHEALKHLFQAMICVPIDYEIGQRAGDYLQRFTRSHGLQLGDALIAATASLNRAALWTRNRKHYPMKDLSFY